MMPLPKTESPLAEARDAVVADQGLVGRALAGETDALTALVRRHTGWIFNIAVRMLFDRTEAEDATQEILVKIVTSLGTFRGESAFRTWAYRIATRHLLDCRRSPAERAIGSFGCYGLFLDSVPDDEHVEDREHDSAERRLLIEEAKIGCTQGMLLCLDREQRLVFVLGEIFDVTDVVGAEVLETTRENFRQKLRRARQQLGSFMGDRCGLIDPANPCRCAKKTRGFVQAGVVDPRKLQFAAPHLARIRDVAPRRHAALRAVVDRAESELYRQHPFLEPTDLPERLRAILAGAELRRTLELEASNPARGER